MEDQEIMLSQINQPAFLVQNGEIICANQRAMQYMVEIGTPVSKLLISGKEEYSEFQSGSIYLIISLCGTEHPCCVTQLQDHQLFIVEESPTNAQLQVLALAAQQLCMPLSEITLLLDRITNIPDADKAQVKHNLYKLQRIIGNMSDAENLINSKPNMRTCEICSFMEEILEKAKTLLSQSGISLQYQLPNQPIFTQADSDLIKRAVYNLISNAAKFGTKLKPIKITLKQNGNRVYMTVSGGALSNVPADNVFRRYSRQPGLEDPRFGLGLGMSFVHAATSAHGGTVLVEKTQDGTKVTMTLAITKSTQSVVRSPILIPDLYGGRDQALIELSDILSYQLYMD